MEFYVRSDISALIHTFGAVKEGQYFIPIGDLLGEVRLYRKTREGKAQAVRYGISNYSDFRDILSYAQVILVKF